MTTSEAYAVCKRNGVNVAPGSLLAKEIAPVLLALEAQRDAAIAWIETQTADIVRLQKEVAALKQQAESDEAAFGDAAEVLEQQVAVIDRLRAELRAVRNLLEMSLAENQRLRATMDGMLAEREGRA